MIEYKVKTFPLNVSREAAERLALVFPGVVMASADSKPAMPRKQSAHEYLSTGCTHGLHEQCRKRCKFCRARCRCDCHRPAARGLTREQIARELDRRAIERATKSRRRA